MGTAFPLLKVFENALWTALRTIFRQKSALQDFVYTVSTFSGGDYPRNSAAVEAPPVLDTNFRLARQRSHCSCFTKRPLFLVV